MKRTIAFACALILFLLPLPVHAADNATVTGESVMAKPGKYVSFSVNISNNPGLAAFMIYVECDTSLFSVDYDEDAGEYCVDAGGFSSAGTTSCNTYGTWGWVITWFNLTDVQTDGSLFTLNLLVNEDTPEGDYPIEISFSPGNTVDEQGARVSLTAVDGVISVLPETAVATLGGAEVTAPGNDYALTVKLDANPGIMAFMLYIDCDVNSFDGIYDSVKDSYSVEQGDFAPGGTILCSKNGTQGFKVLWFGQGEATGTGTLFTLPLKISSGAELGAYRIGLRFSALDVTDAQGAVVSAQAEGGTVTLKAVELTEPEICYNAATGRAELSVTPLCLDSSKTALIFAATYSSAGRMLACQLKSISGSAALETVSFELACPETEGSRVRLYALDAGTLEPLAELPPRPVSA